MNTSPELRPLVLIGMSLNNSYFTRNNVYHLFEDMHERRPEASLRGFIVEAPAVYNYLALGYDKQNALNKARREGGKLAREAEAGLYGFRTAHHATDARLMRWISPTTRIPIPYGEPIKTNTDQLYTEMTKSLAQLYANAGDFRQLIDNVSRTALETLAEHLGRDTGKDPETYGTNRGKFLLRELAFLLAAPRRFERPVIYAYHRPFEPLETLLQHKKALREQGLFEIPETLSFERLTDRSRSSPE